MVVSKLINVPFRFLVDWLYSELVRQVNRNNELTLELMKERGK